MTVLVSAAVGVVASVLTAYVTAHLAARQEIQRWRKDLAQKYAALATERPAQAQALTRQFPRMESFSMIAGSTAVLPSKLVTSYAHAVITISSFSHFPLCNNLSGKRSGGRAENSRRA
jgi:hypothetical protein